MPSEKTTEDMVTEFKGWLQENGHSVTKTRVHVASVLLSSGESMTLCDILRAGKLGMRRLGYATVYRTVNLLIEAGMASEASPAAAARYGATR